MFDECPVTEFDGIQTLPLVVMTAITQEGINPFGSGKVAFKFRDPQYRPSPYGLDSTLSAAVSQDPQTAKNAVDAWPRHLTNFSYYVQFCDDPSGQFAQALYKHTELIVTLCDTRLGLDPSPLLKSFHGAVSFSHVHAEYRADSDREINRERHIENLDRQQSLDSQYHKDAMILIPRIVKQIELKSNNWESLPPILPVESKTNSKDSEMKIELLYSYSHKDENLRDNLENHLSILKRNGVIDNWHDRCITAGEEWKGKIDAKLESANIILLLVSSDFLASDYCYDIEMKRAMERHESGNACVIPVILRSVDWHDAPFGKLQALPKDGKPVTSWANVDEAFTDVAKGMKKAAEKLRSP